MNKILPILLLFSLLLIPIIDSAYAVKSKGTTLPATNSDKICGVELCSEIGQSKPIPPQGQIVIPAREKTIDVDKEATSLLYVQTADSGTFVQKDGRNILTLVEVSQSTVWFTDRPQRVTGHELTELFIAKWDEGEDSFADDPPNAALDILNDHEESDVFIVELKNPVYNPDSDTLQYDVRILEEATQGLSHYSKDISTKIPSTFEQATLFIDDSPCSSYISGVGDFYGIDITKGISTKDLIPHAIFDLYGDDTRTQVLGDCSYDVPNSLLYERGGFDVDYEVYKSFDELKKSIVASAGLSYSSTIIDADIKTQYSHSTDDAKSSYFATVRAYNNLYSLTLETPSLSKDFQNALDNLPDQYDGNQQAYFDFFSNYGTHYTQHTEYGGHVIYSSQETDTSSITETDFQASVNVKVNEFIGGSADLSSSIDTKSSETKSDSSLIIKVDGSGGDPGKLHVVVTDSSSNSFNDWWATIDSNPGQIGIKYREIYNLVSDSTKKSQIAKALDDYLRQEIDYRITLTNHGDPHQIFAKIEIGTNQDNPQVLKLDTFQVWDSNRKVHDTTVPYGGILAIADIKTGKINPTYPEGVKRWESQDELLVPLFSQMTTDVPDSLFFIVLYTPFSPDYADEFSGLENIGASSFADIPKGVVMYMGKLPADIDTIAENGGVAPEVVYMLVGTSHLGQGNGQEHFKAQTDTGNASTEIMSDQQLQDWVSNYPYGFGNMAGNFECEMTGSISKTIEGFTEFTTSTFDCN